MAATSAASSARLSETVATASELVLRGEPDRAVALASAALASCSTHRRAATAEAVRVIGLLIADDLSAARSRAESLLASRDNDDVTAAALTTMALTAWDAGRSADGLALLRAVTRRARRSSTLITRVFPLLRLAAALTALGDRDEADQAITRLTADVAEGGSTRWSAAPLVRRAVLDLASGRLDDAVTSAGAALVVCDDLGTKLFTPSATAVIAEVALLRGDVPEAVRRVAAIRATGPRRESVIDAGTVVWLEARIVEARGETTGASLAVLRERLLTHPRLLLEEPSAAAWLVRTALRNDDHRTAQAVGVLAKVTALANDETPSLLAAAAHTSGLIDGDAQPIVSAALIYREPRAAGWAFEDAATLLARDGDRAEAHRRLAQAAESFSAGGSALDAARVLRHAAVLGRDGSGGAVSRAVSGWDSLTRNERLVAAAVAEGLTNARAGERLHISRYTVDSHLRQIFRKLDVNSRVAVVPFVLEHPAR